MISMILQSIDGVGIYPTVSLIIFFIIFAFMAVKVFLLDKKYVEKMRKLPLEND
jgi:hypothetical protein